MPKKSPSEYFFLLWAKRRKYFSPGSELHISFLLVIILDTWKWPYSQSISQSMSVLGQVLRLGKFIMFLYVRPTHFISCSLFFSFPFSFFSSSLFVSFYITFFPPPLHDFLSLLPKAVSPCLPLAGLNSSCREMCHQICSGFLISTFSVL